MLTGTSMSDGVLSDRELRQGVGDGWIVSPVAIDDQQFQPASLDLRLGPDAYQLRASFLPFRESVQGRLGERGLAESDLVIDQLSLTGSGATLQRGSVYLVPLLESLDLPPDVRGRSNPKSTTGRLDIFTRVITDATPRFDEIRAGYRGALYLEVSPQSFPVRVQAGVSLNQIRLLAGQTSMSDAALEGLYREQPLLYDDDERPIPPGRVVVSDGLCMGVDLSGRLTDGIIGYRAHPNPPGCTEPGSVPPTSGRRSRSASTSDACERGRVKIRAVVVSGVLRHGPLPHGGRDGRAEKERSQADEARGRWRRGSPEP